MTGSPSVTTLPSSLNSTCNSWAGAVKVLRKFLWLYVGQPTLQGGRQILLRPDGDFLDLRISIQFPKN